MVIVILSNYLVQMGNKIILFIIPFLIICFIYITKKITNYFYKTLITYDKTILIKKL